MDNSRSQIKPGRPRIEVDYELILRLRDVKHLGWTLGAEEYLKRTNQGISRDTFKRRYREYKSRKNPPVNKLAEEIMQRLNEQWSL